MKKYIVLYYAPISAKNQINVDPNKSGESMEKWMAWAKKCGDALIDLGSPLGNTQKIMQAGSEASDSQVVGYSILQAETMEDAKALMEGHPHLWMDTCRIELHESLPMPQ